MKKSLAIIVLFAFVALVVACGHDNRPATEGSATDIPSRLKDSILFTYGYNPSKALMLLDSVVEKGNITDYTAKLLRSIIYANSVIEHHLDSAWAISIELLQHDSVVNNPGEKENLFNQLINISRKREDFEQYLNWSIQKAELCKQEGEETELLRTEAEIGLVLTHLGQIDEGLTKIKHSAKLLDVSGSIDKMDAFIVVTKRLITVLEEQDRYSDVVPYALSILHRLDDYQSHPDDYADDSYRLPNVKVDRGRYVDFYRAQAYAYLVIANAQLGNRKQAYSYLDHLKETQYGSTPSAQNMLGPAYLLLGEYDKLMTIYETATKQMGTDTVNGPYVEMLRGRAVMADARGKLVDSRNFWRRYAELYRVLSDSLQKSKAHQYAAHYHAQEQQMELEKKDAELKRSKIYLIASAIIILLTLCFAIYFFRQRRKERQKNYIIVKQISEASKYKQEYEALVAARNEVKTMSDSPENVDMPSVYAKMTYEQLFSYISEVIIREKLFLDPYFDRRSVVARFQLTEKQVGAAFSKGSEYKSLPGFVREQRLLYACQLLREKPELSIKEVAAASAFSSQPRFTIDFKERFSFSPSEYREMALQKTS